ncbi:MAG: aromatic amino acid hydroxylase [Bacteroidetes bacterium]|nr:aromatic amino acid hydroxylase [Bacteroidota bacterium]
MLRNDILERLPLHLKQLIIDQDYQSYTWQDHAVWRFVMKQNVAFLSDKAHAAYLDGLRKTGISIDRIPDTDTMNSILSEIGWAAVTVDGFIPPAAFMEFQAFNVLVIAADIRPLDQVEYTPAPDIIHEAAGHAPIIADPEYAEYLRYFGEIGSKAFSSAADFALYEAIRHLSILKADPFTPEADIREAEKQLQEKEAGLGEPSEMALIRNLHWWTVEYGLIGELDNPGIYGAGLLSSIGESAGALSSKVKKLPYSIEAVHYNFDITTQQPQLFVTPDFRHLTHVLDAFADTMALRRGGPEGIRKAIDSANTASCVYDSGLQVSGTFSEVIMHHDKAAYLMTQGPTSLCFNNKLIDGHGTTVHQHGFGSPIGRFNNINKPPGQLSDDELTRLGLVVGQTATLLFESGVSLQGKLISTQRCEGSLVLLGFDACTVRYHDRLLFDPSWGTYDMAVGEAIVSAFGGPADADAYGLEYPVPAEKTHKIQYSEASRGLHRLYGELRLVRESGRDHDRLLPLWKILRTEYPNDWLLPVELAELLHDHPMKGISFEEVVEYLKAMAKQKPAISNLINRGLAPLLS